MDRLMLTTLEHFEKNILWPKDSGDMPKPSQTALDIMTKAVNALFDTEGSETEGSETEGSELSEDASDVDIGQTIVDEIINKVILPSQLRAATWEYEDYASYPRRWNLDAALYPADMLPNDDGLPDWTHLRLYIKFEQGGADYDRFDQTKGNPEAWWSPTQARVQEQLLSYAFDAFQHQHRTWLYSLLINGDEFRAMRWDRAGLIVTEATNYVEDPTSLLRFLLTFASLTDEQQGIDPTATLLSPDSAEYRLMDAWALENPALDVPSCELDDIPDFFDPSLTDGEGGQAEGKSPLPSDPIFKYVRDGFRDSLESGWPRYKLLVGSGLAAREFLVGKPVFTSASLFGRGTRGYIAYDVEGSRFVFLKDTWRPLYDGAEPEGNYLCAMASNPDIKLAIPTVVEHGDVLAQKIFVAQYAMNSHSSTSSVADSTPSTSAYGAKRPREEEEEELEELVEGRQLLIHYRIVVEEVCLKFEQLSSGRQLVRLILDSIVTHRDAFTHFNLLHCNISPGNVLILPRTQTGRTGKRRVTWHGFLTGWRLARYTSKDGTQQYTRQPEETGTWPYMSAARSMRPERPIGVADELESFFHLLLYHSVRYLRHTHKQNVGYFIASYFGGFMIINDQIGSRRCSFEKIRAVTDGRLTFDMTHLYFLDKDNAACHPLNDLLDNWLGLFNARYRRLKAQAEDFDAAVAAAERKRSQDSAPCQVQEKVAVPQRKVLTDGFPDPLDRRRKLIRRSEEARAAAIAAVADARARTAAAKAEARSEETRQTAARLDAHAATIEIFRLCLRQYSWPGDDFVGDQLGERWSFKKRPPPSPELSAVQVNDASGCATSSSKKARVDSSESATDPASKSPERADTTGTQERKSTKNLLRARPLRFR